MNAMGNALKLFTGFLTASEGGTKKKNKFIKSIMETIKVITQYCGLEKNLLVRRADNLEELLSLKLFAHVINKNMLAFRSWNPDAKI